MNKQCHGICSEQAQSQVLAATMISQDFYRKAGGKPFLIIQPTEDFIVPPDKAGKAIKADLGKQVSYVEVIGAGYMICSERPEDVAKHLVNYFQHQ